MCTLLWTAINVTFWVCDLDSIPSITNSPVPKNKTIQFQNNLDNNTNNLINISNNLTNNTKFNINNLTNYTINDDNMYRNNTIENITLPITKKNNISIVDNNFTKTNNTQKVFSYNPSPSKQKFINKFTPSPVKNIDSESIDTNSEDVILELDKNTTNTTNSSYLDKTNIKKIEIDNLVFLHFLWSILPLICFYGYYYRKRKIKSNKIGCFNFTTKNKLKRCKSMPNIYAAVPTAPPKRMAVSDSEIDVIVL